MLYDGLKKKGGKKCTYYSTLCFCYLTYVFFLGAIVQDEEEYLKSQQNIPRTEREQVPSSPPRCTTPVGGPGKCMDIQNCPILLADLGTLRKSVSYLS